MKKLFLTIAAALFFFTSNGFSKETSTIASKSIFRYTYDRRSKCKVNRVTTSQYDIPRMSMYERVKKDLHDRRMSMYERVKKDLHDRRMSTYERSRSMLYDRIGSQDYENCKVEKIPSKIAILKLSNGKMFAISFFGILSKSYADILMEWNNGDSVEIEYVGGLRTYINPYRITNLANGEEIWGRLLY